MATSLRELAQKMVDILDLKTQPVAVKFCERTYGTYGDHLEQRKMRYCQALMLARHGEEAVLTVENIACPAAAAAFGFKPLPEKIAEGDMLANLGLPSPLQPSIPCPLCRD